MSSPENKINPPDNTSQEPNTESSTDPALTDEEANFGFTDPAPDPPPPINPPDNT